MKYFWFSVPLFLIISCAHADDAQSSQWQFYPSVGLGWHKLEFKRPDGTLSADYKTLNLGLTATHGDYFVSVDGEWFGKSNFQNGVEFTSVEREDQTLTIGKIIDQYSVFVGYTDAETKDDFLGEFHFDRGYFIGAGYDFPFGVNVLGISIAYADLDGKIYEDEVGLIETGDTQGLSYRIGYSGPFRKNMGYKVFARYRSYEFDGGDVVTDKDILSVGASISF